MGRPRAIGKRGWWFAEVLDKTLPCVSDEWLKRGHYLDPGARPGTKRWDRYVEAIMFGQVILTNTQVKDGKRSRQGYVAVFKVFNVVITTAGLEFDLGEPILRLA